MMNSRPNNKKGRSTSNRGGRGKGGERLERQLSVEGVYANHRFMQSVGTLVGLHVQVLTKTKEVFEGVFTTFGPNFDLVLDLPHIVSTGENNSVISNSDSIKKKMIFSAQDIVLIKSSNVDLDYATKENFAVDSVISKFNGQSPSEKELEPWQGEEHTYTDLGLGDENANGWDANEMFRKNEEKYGVTTTYNPEMKGYTTPLQKRDTKEWKEQEAKAEQIAQEIEQSPVTQTRADVENGDEDEEQKFSAVIRPDNSGPTSGGPSTGKYMPPQRRKTQGVMGGVPKQPPRGSPSPQGGGMPPSMSSGGRYSSHSQNMGPIPSQGPPQTSHGPQQSQGPHHGRQGPHHESQGPHQGPQHVNQGPHHSPQGPHHLNQGPHQGSQGPQHGSQGPHQGPHHMNQGPHQGPQGPQHVNQGPHQGSQGPHHGSQGPHQGSQGTPPYSSTQSSSVHSSASCPQQSSSMGAPPQQSSSMGAPYLPKHSPHPPTHKQPPIPPQHSIQGDAKLNGEPKDPRRPDNPQSYLREPPHKEGYHLPPEPHPHGAPHPHHPHHHSNHQPGPPYQPTPSYHTPPPREPRKPRNQRDEQRLAGFKEFSQNFKLSEGGDAEKKGIDAEKRGAHGPPHQGPSQPPHPQHPPPHMGPVPPTMGPPGPGPSVGPKHHTNVAHPPPTPPASQPPAPTPQQAPPPVIPPQHPSNVAPTPPQETHQGQHHQVPPTNSGGLATPASIQQEPQQPPQEGLKTPTPSGDEEKIVAASKSNLNPEAKEFVFNPNAKPFNPRSPSTTTPPRAQTPLIAPPAQPQMSSGGAAVPSMGGFPQNVLQTYVIPTQPFQMQSNPRYPKRGPAGNQRPDYGQVAAATGHPILAPTPLTPIATQQAIPAVQIPQTPQYPYQSVLFRLPPPSLPMVTTMVPTSMGMYYQGGEGHQNAQGHTPQHMYVTPGVQHHPGHQPIHAANPGPHPGQPPTPQGHGHSNSGGPAQPPPNMNAQPPTPGPTPPQAMMFSGPGGAAPMGGQPTITQHLPQHSPHPAQSPHTPHTYNNATLAAVAASHHPTQLVMIPPHMTHHMMTPGHGGPPPHSGAGHAPSSGGAGLYTTTSTQAIHHMSHGHPVQYIPGAAGNQLHPLPIVHHNQ